MKITICALLICMSGITYASNFDCEGALTENYANAISELAQSQLKLDQMRIEDSANDAALRFMTKQIEIKKQKIVEAIGQSTFNAEFTKALRQHSGLFINNETNRQVRRQKALKEESVLGTWAELRVLKQDLEVEKILITPDSRHILIMGEREIEVFDSESGQNIHNITVVDRVIVFESMSLSPDGRFVIATANDGVVRVWDIATGRESQRFEVIQDSMNYKKISRRIVSAEFSPDGRYVITVSNDSHAIKVWDIATGKLYFRFKTAVYDQNPSVDISPDGRYLLINSWGHRFYNRPTLAIEIIDLKTKKKAFHIPENGGAAGEARFLADSRHVITTVTHKEGYSVWDLQASKAKGRFDFSKVGEPSLVTSFGPDEKAGRSIITPDQKKMILKSRDSITVIEIENFNALDKSKELYSIDRANASSNFLAVSSDSQVMALFDYNEVGLWNLSSGRKENSIRTEGAPRHMLFSPDRKFIVTADENYKTVIWHYIPNVVSE